MTLTCPAPEDRSRQITLGEHGPLAAHLSNCATCALEWEELQRIRALASELPAALPEPKAALAVRDRVVALALAEQRRARVKSAGAWALLAVAAAVVLVIGLRSRGAGEPIAVYRATLTPSPGARFVRESAAPIEAVRLESGTLHVAVEKLQARERFFVRAGDSEVEVRGTAFDVAVFDGRLSAVHVDHGRVEVRGPSGAPTMLGAGDDWQRAPERVDEPSAQPLAEPKPRVSMSPTLPPPQHRVEPGPGASVSPPLLTPPPSASTFAVPSPASAAVEAPPGAVASSATSAIVTSVAPRAIEAPSPPASSAFGPASRASDRAREQERRERRDERRERSDQRRLR
jgi:hypothetical protein